MEIRIYNTDMNLQGIVENQTSLIWTRKYSEPGCFELYAPITEENRKLLKRGNLVFKRGGVEAGIIEDLKLEENSTKNEITAKGRFLSAYMERRLIHKTISFSGKVEEAMRELLANSEEIPRVELGTLQGFDATVEFQATYKNLLTYEKKLAKSANLGMRFRPDFNRKRIRFEIYAGVNRTVSQGVNNRVIFSETYNNLNNAIYRENDQTYKNVVYVGGEGEGDARVVVKVGDASGLELREMFLDAKDIRSDDLTEEEYITLLQQRGREVLKENEVSQSFECDTGADVNFVYGVNYDLGDIVTVKKKGWEITQDLRITEIQEVYEYGGMKVVPTLGTPLPETIDWSD